jgi:hypothetical protein
VGDETMSQTTIEQNLHQEVEVSYWDDASQTHSIYKGRLLDINKSDNWVMLKCASEVVMLDIEGIENIFVSGREVSMIM